MLSKIRIVSAYLALNNMLVDLSCSNIVLTGESDIQIALVVSQIEINLSSVIENKNLSVPIGKDKINISMS